MKEGQSKGNDLVSGPRPSLRKVDGGGGGVGVGVGIGSSRSNLTSTSNFNSSSSSTSSSQVLVTGSTQPTPIGRGKSRVIRPSSETIVSIPTYVKNLLKDAFETKKVAFQSNITEKENEFYSHGLLVIREDLKDVKGKNLL